MADEPRRCGYCEAPIPSGKSRRARYCNPLCGRKGHYWSMTEEQRKAYNKRSNTRRYQKDLKPKIEDIVNFADEITHGTPLAQYVVSTLYVASKKDWKLGLALNYQIVREALADMAGGWDELAEIEERVEDNLIKVMAKHLSMQHHESMGIAAE